MLPVQIHKLCLLWGVWLLLGGCAEEAKNLSPNLAEYTLPNLSGETEKLMSDDSKVRIINFWATWCAPCREEMPDLQALDSMLDAEQFEVVGVTVDRDLNLVREFLLKYDIKFRQLSDPGMALASGEVAVTAFPETLLVDSSGRIVNRVVGMRPWADPDYVRKFLGPIQTEVSSRP